MQHVYITYNALAKTYSAPVVRDADPKVYGKQLSDFVVLYPDKAKQEFLGECQVYYIGEFDQERGIILFSNPDQTGDLVFDGIQVINQLEALKHVAAAD